MKKILHAAVENYAGVPYDFSQMHNQCGDYSRLITHYNNIRGFKEDITLNFYIPRSTLAVAWRHKKRSDLYQKHQSNAPEFRPKNTIESLYFAINDVIRTKRISSAIHEYNLDDFDIIHYDGGMDFTRKPSQALIWKNQGKKIITCYYGSDLRTRGYIRELEEITDLSLTTEYDHLQLMDGLHYLFYPYDTSELPKPTPHNSSKISIVHSPTNRQFKGTDGIIRCIEKLQKSYPIEFHLLENIPRTKVLEIKKQCDICIDQVGGTQGGTGYGKSGLETLAMSIPTITNMTEDYARWLPDNPFIIANTHKELENVLVHLIENKDYRINKGQDGKRWVETYHSYQSVNNNLYTLYKKNGIV